MRSWTPELRARLASLRLTPEREAAIIEELSQHLDDRREEMIAGGLTADDATAAILMELRNADQLTARLGSSAPGPHADTRHSPERDSAGCGRTSATRSARSAVSPSLRSSRF